ncbi:PfkB domain protein [Methanocaldococcus villosus KIN24-T80]|uniref:PfkB domain protein n=1 Tax=Methanocaldococcus villosus KIN24-T80 TaxID=1069083 RepID=N6VRH4_9EURY|nr:carbohydrate kinase family protein [Methanocaldococcus villosus]ENN95761.1 PfkB domain protein [Methanocaldococcus villosus KIN24-T80]
MITCIGHIALDYIFNIDRFPEPNSSVQIPSAKLYYGGAAANTAVAIKKLGVDCELISCVGYDFKDSRYEKYLKKLGVNISKLYYSEDEETPKAWIFTDKENNQITFFLWGAAKHYKELNPPNFDTNIVHIATGDPDYNLRAAKKAYGKAIVSFDPGQDLPQYSENSLRELIKHTNFLFLNKYEFDRISKMLNFNLDDFLKYVDILVVTKGEKGSTIYTEENKKIEIPVIKAKVVDPTGAGDAYRAGFLVAYLKKYPLEKCGLIASAAASFVVEAKGSQTNLPTWDMVLNRLKRHGFNL